MKTKTIWLTAFVACLLANGLQAQSWSELTARQQRQLSDFQPFWSQLPDNRKTQLVRSAEQISRMSAANRRRLVDSMRQANGAANPSGNNASP